MKLTISALQPITINVPLLGTLTFSLTIPLIADVGYGNAAISSIGCGSDILATTDIAVQAQSGAVRLYIGDVNDAQLTDLTNPLIPTPTSIIDTALVSVTTESQSLIAQSGIQTVHFGYDDIDAGTVKTVDGSSGLSTVLTDLNSSAQSNLQVTVSGLPGAIGATVSSLLQPLASAQMAAILSALQPELNSILASVGLRAGTIELRATGARCGIPALAT
jgi:uncharacterized membrane protein